MTNHPAVTAAAQAAHARRAFLDELRATAPEALVFRGLRVELGKCTPAMRDTLLAYNSPDLEGSNPLAAIEDAEAKHVDRAATELTVTMLAEGRDDEAIEDALASLREHLAEHFRQRKLNRLYEGR